MNRRRFFQAIAAGLATAALTTRLAQSSTQVNVADYGADLTGITDSTDAINRAIDFAYVRGEPLYFPPGRYLMKDSNLLMNGLVPVIIQYCDVTFSHPAPAAGRWVDGSVITHNVFSFAYFQPFIYGANDSAGPGYRTISWR